VEGYIVKKKVFVLIDSRSIYYFIWLKVGLPLTARRHDSIFVVGRHSDEECSLYSCAYDVSGTGHRKSFHQ
jgi:hypothetical protein